MTAGAGFENTLVFAENADFSGGGALGRPALANGLQTNGQLWVGSTALNAGNTHINVGNITSPLGTITVGYSSPNITVDLAGGSTGVDSFLTDSGAPAVVPEIGGQIQILGGPGVTVTGQGPSNVVTVNSVVYTDQPATTTIDSDSGSFVNAGGNIILNLPATPAQGELIEVVCTTANLVAIDAPATHFIRIGTLITSVGGTATSTQIGDAIKLRWRDADLTWYAISVIGTWSVA